MPSSSWPWLWPWSAKAACWPSLATAGGCRCYLLAAAFIWTNLRTPWLWLMALGLAANAAAVLANGGFMPVPPGAAGGAAAQVAARGYYNNAVLMTQGSPLWFLGDVLTIPSWWGGRWAVSAGDLLIAVATFGLVQRLMQPAGRGTGLLRG